MYDAVNVLVAAMVKANSAEPAKYLPVLAKTSDFKGVTGTIAFDAKGDIKNPQGVVVEKKGAVRDGGSFYDRMGAVACWNAVMDEDRYMVQKWNQFIAA